MELADFLRLVRLSAIKFATDHFKVCLSFPINFSNVFSDNDTCSNKSVKIIGNLINYQTK